MPVVESRDLRTETDRKGLDRDSAPTGHQEVAELVDEDHDGEHEQEGKEITEYGIAEAGKLNYRIHKWGLSLKFDPS